MGFPLRCERSDSTCGAMGSALIAEKADVFPAEETPTGNRWDLGELSVSRIALSLVSAMFRLKAGQEDGPNGATRIRAATHSNVSKSVIA